jgi:hypothetical protein
MGGTVVVRGPAAASARGQGGTGGSIDSTLTAPLIAPPPSARTPTRRPCRRSRTSPTRKEGPSPSSTRRWRLRPARRVREPSRMATSTSPFPGARWGKKREERIVEDGGERSQRARERPCANRLTLIQLGRGRLHLPSSIGPARNAREIDRRGVRFRSARALGPGEPFDPLRRSESASRDPQAARRRRPPPARATCRRIRIRWFRSTADDACPRRRFMEKRPKTEARRVRPRKARIRSPAFPPKKMMEGLKYQATDGATCPGEPKASAVG